MQSNQQLNDFRRDGYLVLEKFASHADCDALVARAAELVAEFVPPHQKSVFSTTEQKQTSDAYFLESGDKIRFFFEPDAFDAEGTLRQDKMHSINKIGHALHDLDPVFDAFSRQARLAEIADDVGFADPLLLQSMVIFKPPRIGAATPRHQDAAYWEPAVIHRKASIWVPLQPATPENGCMQFVPRSHQSDVMPHQSIRNDPRIHGLELPATEMHRVDGAVTCPLAPGGATVHDGYTLHYTAANRTNVPRRAIILSASAGTTPRSKPRRFPWMESKQTARMVRQAKARDHASPQD